MYSTGRSVVIIGGGVAGLTAAIGLQQQGFHSHIIEAGDYPTHKVCGEFITPESLPILESWGIPTVPIYQAQFHSGKKSFKLPFPLAAGSLSHGTLDPQLLAKALSLGATIQKGVRVDSFEPKRESAGLHTIHLSTGETLHTSTAIIATGRLPTVHGQHSTPTPKYVGFKAHFTGIPLTDTLEMFLTDGAYLGMSPVEEGKVNIACLVKGDRLKHASSIDTFVHEMGAENPKLREYLAAGTNLFENWLQTPAPAFGFRSTPDWLDVFFIGDAAMAIPPAYGQGLSLAIDGGLQVAQAIALGDTRSYHTNQKKRHLRQMWEAKCLHYTLMHPLLSRIAFAGCSHFPSLATNFSAFGVASHTHERKTG